MNLKSLITSASLFFLMHTLVWFSTNLQFIKNYQNRSFEICVILAIPTSLLAYYAARYGYEAFNTVWSVRLMGFGLSYLVFPLMSWILLNESPFEPKTMISIALSALIVGLQLFWK